MTLKEYIETLKSTGLFGRQKSAIVIELFCAAGSKQEFAAETATAWMNNRRNCNIKRYFPDEYVNEAEVIKYFKRKAKDRDAWNSLQKAFRPSKKAKALPPDFRVDIETEDPEVFYWSLLNQFQKIFNLPESEREVTASEGSVRKELSTVQAREIFLKVIHHFKIIEIINRKPAILNRADSTALNVFLMHMDTLIMELGQSSDCNPTLRSHIMSFTHSLQIQTLTLDCTLNNNFGFDDDSAVVNMEDEDDSFDLPSDSKRPDTPELTSEILRSAEEPMHIAKIAVSEWGNFRNNMNFIYDAVRFLNLDGSNA